MTFSDLRQWLGDTMFLWMPALVAAPCVLAGLL
jgi:hypothetical protein